MANPYSAIPSVHELLESPELVEAAKSTPRHLLIQAIRKVQNRIRSFVTLGRPVPELDVILEMVVEETRLIQILGLRQVINATGIILHTNLGRAPLAEAAAQAAYRAARSYVNLEVDLTTGKRSSRQEVVRKLWVDLTNAESATVVNNCAAATVLVLRTLAAGREVIVSRGQLIEIGGSFRIPEIMAVSGATLREVGTTNITRIADYERAITSQTAALMRVHTSNYRIHGFTQSPTLRELVDLGRRAKLPVIDDIGSGALFDFSREVFATEPRILSSIEAGADLVLFSGDKLFGGPQAGIILGRKELIDRLERDPLMRAFRVDKMTLAAMQATLELYYTSQTARASIPVLRMIHTSVEDLRTRAEHLAQRLAALPDMTIETRDGVSLIGGGSLPEEEMPTCIVNIATPDVPEDRLAEKLRLGDPAVLTCLRDGRVRLDMRTVFPEQDGDLVDAVGRAISSLRSSNLADHRDEDESRDE